MTFIADSPLVNRVHPSPDGEMWDRRGAPIRGIAIHMAQGGGTESHLDNLDGNSSHYVIKYTGALIQMVPERLAAGSMDPSRPRFTDDAPFVYGGETVTYGYTALRRCLGTFVSDPNRVAIAIEIEGFAGANASSMADPLGGPNDVQERTLVALVNDIRRRRGYLPVFGHRDQQSYKLCPGRRIPWHLLGGHAVVAPSVPDTSTEVDDMKIQAKPERWDLDGGPGKVTTLGAPYIVDGSINWQFRLAFLSDRGGANPRFELIPRTRLSNPSDVLAGEILTILALYALPAAPPVDCSAETGPLEAEIGFLEGELETANTQIGHLEASVLELAPRAAKFDEIAGIVRR